MTAAIRRTKDYQQRFAGRPADMDETTYLNAPDATVTSTRIVIGQQTFATRNVGSVAVHEVAKPNWPIFIGLIGGAMVLSGFSSGFGTSTLVGIAMFAGAASVFFKPATLQLKLVAGGGEIMALETTDRSAIDTLHRAIVSAIAAR